MFKKLFPSCFSDSNGSGGPRKIAFGSGLDLTKEELKDIKENPSGVVFYDAHRKTSSPLTYLQIEGLQTYDASTEESDVSEMAEAWKLRSRSFGSSTMASSYLSSTTGAGSSNESNVLAELEDLVEKDNDPDFEPRKKELESSGKYRVIYG